LGSKSYGDSVTIDAGTYNTDYDFVTYIVNGKVESALPANHTFIVSSDLEITALYKPNNTVMVAFMDSNQDMLSIQYVPSGNSATPPDVSGLTKSGYEVAISEWSGSYTAVTEDTVLWVQYTPLIGDTFTLSVTNGTADQATYNYNEVATVTASGTGNFQHWEKDGYIMSLNPTFSFTVLDNIELTAIYDDVEASPNPDSLFINMSMNSALDMVNMLFVGQFVLPEGNSLVEYGFITSTYEGGITFDTPDVVKIRSNKYFAQTNEFVRSISFEFFMGNNIRAYMVTTNGTTETITYADTPVYGELFISEYIEGSSYNKAIEIYNGMGHDINLAVYSLALYANGSATSTSTYDLTGTLASGDVIVIAHASSGAEILAAADVLDSVVNFNGDDAVALLKSSSIIDVIGEVGVDPGSSWDSMTADHTITRKSSVISPSNVWNSNEWDVHAQDDFTYIGSHSLSIVEPTALTITGTASVMAGLTTDLDVTYDPTTATQNVIWVSSNTGVATIDQSGVVTGVSAGSVTIAAYSYINNNVYDTETVTVTAPVTYTVSFEENGGSTVADQSGILEGTTATSPTPPTLTGYVFDGWYTDDTTFLNQYNFATAVTYDLTLYAKWLELFTVTYESNGGSAVDSEDVADGLVATQPTNPTKTDYSFDGWYSDAGLTTPYVFSTPISGDITLYAKWLAMAGETQYIETFDTSTAGGSYGDGSFVGINSVTWTYVESRDDAGYEIDGEGMMLRYVTEFSSLTSNTIAGGISYFKISLLKGYTGAGNRQVRVTITPETGDSIVVDSIAWDNTTVQYLEITGITITGNFTITIENITVKQVVVDNITWTTNTPE
jgi:uncharacterized repeat protein (TIGR02543 family)